VNFMIFMLNHWVVWLTRGYLGLLVCLVLMLVFWKKLELASRKLALASLVWMFGWFFIYLPWDRALDYYLLPFALGYSVFCGVIVGSLPAWVRGVRTSLRGVAIGLTGLFGLLVLMVTVTDASNADIQLIMDRQNMRLFTYLVRVSDPGARIAVNFNANATFFTHIPLLMSIVGNRSDISFVPFSFQNSLSDDNKPYLLIMPVINHPPLSRVRSYNEGQTPVNQSLAAFVKDLQPDFETGEKARLLSFNPSMLLCPFTHQIPFYTIYCTKPASLLVDHRDYSCGWRVYEIDTSQRSMSVPAVYTSAGDLKALDQGTAANWHAFTPGEHPMGADWNGDGLIDLILFNPRDLFWQVFLSPNDQEPLMFSIPSMVAGDVPLAGDWDCNGKASPGFYRASDSSWHLWNDTAGSEEIEVSLTGARPNAIPIIGDWDGNGCGTVGVYRPDKGEVNLENKLTADFTGIDFNAPKDSTPVSADWGGLGEDTLGYYKDGQWQISYANCECQPANGLKQLKFGAPNDVPLAGIWK
jgi:hypothetical protein